MVDQKTVGNDQEQETAGMTAVALALEKANIKSEDFSDTPEARAKRIARIALHRKKGGVVTPEELEARREEHRRRVADDRTKAAEERRASFVKVEEETIALTSVLLEDEDGMRAILSDLKVRAVLTLKPRRTDEEEAALKAANGSLSDVDFDNWHPGEKALLLKGVPEAKSTELRQGLTAWLAEQEAKRQVASQQRRDDDNARRQQLLGLATADLHTAYNDRTDAVVHKVYVDGQYPATRWDEKANNGKGGRVALTTLGGKPVMRRGTFLLTVTDGGRYGQVLDQGINMPMIQQVPHPDQPVSLNPAKDFRTERGQPFFHPIVSAMLAAQWKREEEEAVDTTIYDLLNNGTEGRAMGYLPWFQSRDRVASIKFWVRGAGGRLYLTKADSRTYKGHESFDFTGFPSDGIPLEPADKEPGFIGLVRAILRKMAERHRALDAYEAMKASDTVKSMPEALETGKAVFTFVHDNWGEGNRDTGFKGGPIALQVENTGRGNMRVVSYFATEPALDVPVGTKVPVALDLENGDEFQMRLQRMVKFAAGIKKVAASNGTPVAEPSTDEVGEAAAESSV